MLQYIYEIKGETETNDLLGSFRFNLTPGQHTPMSIQVVHLSVHCSTVVVGFQQQLSTHMRLSAMSEHNIGTAAIDISQ